MKEEMKPHNVWVVDSAIERIDELIANLKILQEKSKIFREVKEGTLIYVEFSKKHYDSTYGKIGYFRGFNYIYPDLLTIGVHIEKGRYVTEKDTEKGFQYMGSTSVFEISIEPEDNIFIGEEEIDKALKKFNLSSRGYIEEAERSVY